MKYSKKRLEEINNLYDVEVNNALILVVYPKKILILSKLKWMLQFYAKDLAKKIRKYFENNK
jgi:hypothetical protein